MTIAEKDGCKVVCNELNPKTRANMERCTNFLVRMINKYGKEVLAEIEAEEKAKAEEFTTQ